MNTFGGPSKLSEPRRTDSLLLRWRDEVGDWVTGKHRFSAVEPNAAVLFFERAIKSVLCPNDAWFGVHKDRVSVVVGGLFLAALHSGKRNEGVWLLLDPEHPLPLVGGLEYHPSDPKHHAPNLRWGHARQAVRIGEIVESDAIWQAVSRASQSVLTTPMGSPRDAIQLKRNKIRVADIRAAEPYTHPSLHQEMIPRELTQPTMDPAELDARARRLRSVCSLQRPTGDRVPAKCTTESRTIYERSPLVKAWVLRQANGRCELCQQEAPFVDAYGEPYLEVHHVQQLARSGADIVENAVALCPNCHRLLHHALDSKEHRERLYRQVFSAR